VDDFEPKRKQRDAFGDGKAGERVAKSRILPLLLHHNA